ncbi:hypothetical protein H0H87_003569, partial [Tephrocybe sp. NHM501043]
MAEDDNTHLNLLSTLISDAMDILEPGGIKIKGDWVEETLEYAIAASKDEPLVQEAISSNETSVWSVAIDAKLSQIKKMDTWDIVPKPSDAN